MPDTKSGTGGRRVSDLQMRRVIVLLGTLDGVLQTQDVIVQILKQQHAHRRGHGIKADRQALGVAHRAQGLMLRQKKIIAKQ